MTRKMCATLFSLLLSAAMTACSQGEPPLSRTGMEMGASAAARQADAPNAMLAYEHRLRVELPAGQVAGRLESAREACETARFGLCHILSIQQEQNASAYLSVRVLPAGVEPLIALARGEDGEVMRRETRAEDLADAVTDNRQQTAQLAAYAERLEALAKRPGIGVSDLISLAREQADVQQKRDALQQEGAQQQRRIDLHLLEIHFAEEGAGEDSFWKKIPDLGGHFSQGIYEALRLTMYGFPFLVLFFVAIVLWRWAWRLLFRRKMVGR